MAVRLLIVGGDGRTLRPPDDGRRSRVTTSVEWLRERSGTRDDHARPGAGCAPSRSRRDDGAAPDGRAVRGARAPGRLLRQRLLQVLVQRGEELLRRQPALLRADEEGEVLRHLAALDGLDADPL